MTPTLSFLARSRSAVTLAGTGKEQGEHLVGGGGHRATQVLMVDWDEGA